VAALHDGPGHQADVFATGSAAQNAGTMIETGSRKANLSTKTILVTGILSGMFLGFTTTLFVSAFVATGNLVIGALFHPVGFILFVLLGLELFTDNVIFIPYAAMTEKVTPSKMVFALVTVYIGNLIGSLIYAVIFAAIGTKFFTDAPDPVGTKIIAITGLKTLA
jgi:formate/nitrite transporter FocA (FNT family)